MNRLPFKKIVLSLIFLLGATLLFMLLGFIYLERSTSEVQPHVRKQIQAIVLAELVSSIVGSGAWEDELLAQGKTAAAMPLGDRLDFDQALLMRFDFDNYRAIYFVDDIIGGDARALAVQLNGYKSTQNFRSLSQQNRHRITEWVEELNVIVKQRDSDDKARRN